MKKLIYFTLIGFLVSCTVFNAGKSSANSRGDTLTYQAIYVSVDSNHVSHFKCDEFASEALESYTLDIFRKRPFRFLKEKREPTVNIHNPVFIDTLYTFYDVHNSVQFYRAQNKDILFAVDVINPKFKLKGNIKPGMTKDDFIEKFNINHPILNDVQFENFDGTVEFHFTFKKNKLKRIIATFYID